MKGLCCVKPVLFLTLLLLSAAGRGEVFSQEKASDSTTRSVAETAGAVEKETTPFSTSYTKPQPFEKYGRQSQGGTAAGSQSSNTYVPMTAGEKVQYGLRSAFLRPEGYIFSALSAAITQAKEEDQPHKTTGDKVADGFSRFARNSASRSTRSVLGSGLYPALFRQDPRYRPSEKKGFGPRALHAVSRVFVTTGDNGRSQPNYSRLAGTMSASALANIWERSTPGHDRIGVRPTFVRVGRSLALDALRFVVFREFWPDIRKIIKR